MKTYRIVAFVSLLSIGLVSHVSAAQWQGGATDNNWSDGNNWVGGVAPTPSAGTALIFDGSNTTSVNNESGFIISGLTFNADASATTGFSLSGSKVTLKTGITDNNDSLTETIDFAGGTSSFSGTGVPISVTTGGTVNLASAWTGSSNISKTGGGTLLLSGTIGYSGTTTFGSNGGSILLATGGSINNTSSVTVGANDTFGTATSNGVALAITTAAPPLTLSLGATPIASSTLALNLFSASSDLLSAGALTLSGTGTFDLDLTDTTATTGGSVSGMYELMSWTSGSLATSQIILTGNAASEGYLTTNAADNELIFNVIPEPGTWAMMLGGMALLVAMRKRLLPSI